MNLLEPLTRWPVANCAAVVCDRGQVLDTLGDQDRVYELASVTKLLSAYGALIAVEEGVFELDTPMGPPGSTVRHLLAHASGLGFAADDPVRPPEQRRVYSSAGFEVLARGLEQHAGIAFPDYLREAVFEPLGMTRTKLIGSAGHGGLSTSADLAAFLAELAAPQLIAKSTLAEAMTPQFPGLIGVVPGYGMAKPCPWGLGFEVAGEKDPHWTAAEMPPQTVGHFGMSGTYLWVIPAVGEQAGAFGAGLGMVALTDRRFQDWAKPWWAPSNAEVWRRLGQKSARLSGNKVSP